MFKKKPKQGRTKMADKANEFYTVSKIGKTREMTPEGYLLCRDVALARTGTLLYGDGEIPVEPDNTGLIVVTRGDDDLFRPETMASAEGKPVTNDHPDDWVKPENWKQLSCGIGQNIRRGEGLEDNLLIGDLLITDKQAIEDVNNGKVEISLGYDTDYLQLEKGKATQSNIVINHIALVEKGRNGNRCAIKDSKTMAKKTKTPWYQALLKTKRTIDEALEKAKETEDGDPDDDPTEDDDDPEGEGKGKTSDAAVNRQILKMLKTMDSRLGALEKKKTKDSDDPEKKTEDGEDDPDDEPTKDDILKAEPAGKADVGTTYTGDSLQDIRARAEILAPGLKIPTLDSSAKDVGKVADTAKRNALKLAYATADGIKTIGPFVGGANANIDALPAHTVDAAFIGASELIKQQNNAKGVRTGITTRDFGRSAPTPADINAKNRAFWNKGQ
jgi:hypothetical protein